MDSLIGNRVLIENMHAKLDGLSSECIESGTEYRIKFDTYSSVQFLKSMSNQTTNFVAKRL